MNPLVIQRIDRIEMETVRLKLASPFETSFSVQRDREALLLKLSSDPIHLADARVHLSRLQQATQSLYRQIGISQRHGYCHPAGQ